MPGQIPTSIAGIIKRINLAESHYLFPLYESVINSIQSIADLKITNGVIDIYIERESAKQIKTDLEIEGYSKIKSFKIVDNGIGFDKDNFTSFQEYYTEHKSALGCKGVGRFMALAAFSKVTVESIYFDKEKNKYYERKIEFDSKNGVKELSNLESLASSRKTIVTLYNYLDKFSKATHTKVVAEHLLQHCLFYYINKANPKIEIFDNGNSEVVNLQEMFDELYSPEDLLDDFTINEEKFEISYIKSYASKGSHRIHLCGNEREVDTIKLTSIIPDFSRPFNDDIGKYNLSVYLKGEYLNKNLNDYRNEFTIPKLESEKKLHDKVSFEEIHDGMKGKLKEKYAEYLQDFSEEKTENLKTYIYSNHRYEYMHLLEYKDLLSTIPPNLNDKDKDYHLHRVNYELEQIQKAKLNEFLIDRNNYKNTDEYKNAFEEILNYENISGKSKLAYYMVHRKAVLMLLDKFIEQQKDGKYKLEEDIHNIIFTMSKDKNEIAFNDHNLWILDERIAFHKYMSSDKGFNEIENVESNSGKAPDLFIYDNKFAYGEDKDVIVLFEFKRPMRDYYTKEEKDLGNQIMDYVDELLDPKAKNSKGRPISITKETPKFGYIICDYHYNSNHVEYLKSRGYEKTPKGSLFQYEKGMNLFIEILTYDQLLTDANLRHRAFFSQLGI